MRHALIALFVLVALAAPSPCPAQAKTPAPPAAGNLTGVWEAEAQGSKLEAFVAQKGTFVLAVAYVSQPDGKISTYHMGGFCDKGRVYVIHKDGYVFDGQTAGPDTINGALSVKNYLPPIETTATRRKTGRLQDDHADQFFRDMLPMYPDDK